MSAKTGTTMVNVIKDALIAEAIPAIVTGACPDITDFRAPDPPPEPSATEGA
jgi:hypothetical protein